VTRPLIRATPALSMMLALMLVACGPASPAPMTSQLATPSPSTGAPATETAAPSAMGSSGASPAAPATTSPRASAAACPVTPQTGLLPSDRLVDLAISSTSTQDLLTFVFEAPSSPSPAGPARGTLGAAKPPFSFAGSGLSIDLLGQHALQLRFSGMTIASESGAATYHGPSDAKPNLPALREAIQYDASEGIVGWYVGYDGPGCVALVRDGNDITVSIAHPEAPAG
jgi:hypothetical protein